MRFLSLFLPRLAIDRIKRGLPASDPAPDQAHTSPSYNLAKARPAPDSTSNARPAPDPTTNARPAPDQFKTRAQNAAPIASVAKVKGAYRVVAVDEDARALGIKPGAALADARAMVPRLAIHEADPAGDAATLVALVDWCRLFTPLAALDAPDGAILDVSGAAHLFGGEEALMDTMVARLQRQGFQARAAIADQAPAAWALARHGGTRRMIAAGASETMLAATLGPLPLAALRLDEEAIARFAQAGLRRIDDLLLRPRAPIAARFGRDIHHRLDALLGRARAPISPRFEAPAFVAERRFAEGIARREGIEATILALCHDLCGLLARHGEGARQLDVALFRVDGVVRHIAVGTSRPLREPATMARLFRERIETIGEDGLDTGYGFDVIRLAALHAERLDPDQADWSGVATVEADLADLIDRLGARFGLDRVTRLAPEDTHIPEQAARERPARAMDAVATAARPPTTGPSATGTSAAGTSMASGERRPDAKRGRGPRPPRGDQAASARRRAGPSAAAGAARAGSRELASWESGSWESGSSITAPADTWCPDDAPSLPARPIRLLLRPEPIDTIASVPDGPPLRFRWRRVTHQVAAIEGPERIGPEWWKGAAPTRDYFRAEDTAGQRFWLFREGLYQDTPAPRWFMHGLFA